MNGENVEPSSTSTSSGVLTSVYDPVTFTLTVRLMVYLSLVLTVSSHTQHNIPTDAVTVAHINGPAFPGQVAPVIFQLPTTQGPLIQASFVLTPTQETILYAGQMYAELNSLAHPNGMHA